VFCRFEDEISDIMAKSLMIEKFKELRRFLNVVPVVDKLNYENCILIFVLVVNS